LGILWGAMAKPSLPIKFPKKKKNGIISNMLKQKIFSIFIVISVILLGYFYLINPEIEARKDIINLELYSDDPRRVSA